MGNKICRDEIREEIKRAKDYIKIRQAIDIEYIYFMRYLVILENIIEEKGNKRVLMRLKKKIEASNSLYMSLEYSNRPFVNNFISINEKLLILVEEELKKVNRTILRRIIP
mgnify:CR=1 FL=1